MSEVPKFDDEDRPSLARAIVRDVAAWAKSETGGWTIIAALVVIALAGLAITFVTRPGPQNPRAASRAEMVDTAAAKAELGDLDAYTVAPDTVQNLSPEGAKAWNAALPFSTAPNRPARPFIAPPDDAQSYSRALDCLTAAVYYEAGSETDAGQAAVAQVILNRARHPAYPRTVCGVVFQGSDRTTGCQFTFTCDGALARVPVAAVWARARAVATRALNGFVLSSVGTATHYHTDWVAPFWAPRLTKIVQIQSHIFYRWNGAWGLPAAFRGVYRGAEPEIGKMAALSTVLPALTEEPLAADDTAIVPPAPQIVIAAPLEDTWASRPAEVRIEPMTTSPAASTSATTAVVSSPPPARREVAPLADPLVNPGSDTRPTRTQRPRIAAPSGW